ncbi:AraC family transcriptional regulator [Paenibacillus lignilyticus]|uniref:AraC family transcriptional regulator n=1 Tax=Paenibacillus lignilyticus TaxID=1172615 RepID=A0ABS5CLU1_9BACL|nr:helix-turn-helix domain-containing protein [Paenibacillus lignilyticus]MBP3966826.1 AraC family transcriptional regulator [Paenibacillus lignilyticus]
MFKKFVLKNPFQLFLTILLPFLVSTVLLLFVQSSLLSRNFENFALKQVYREQLADLQYTSRNVSTLEQTARSVSTTAFFDDIVTDLLYTDIDSDDSMKYQIKLQSYKNIYPFLQSIYIYNGEQIYAVPRAQFIYDRTTFDDQGIFPILDDIKNHPSHSIVLRKIPNIMSGIATGAVKDMYVYSYLFFDSQVASGKVNEAIILNISEEWLRQSIHSQNDAGGSRIFVTDSTGMLLSTDHAHPLLANLSDKPYIQRINASKVQAGNFRMNVDGVDSFVTYTSTDAFDWNLVSITPYHDIVKDVERMKQKTYLFVVLFIVGSILLTFYFSRRLVVPMSLVIQKYNQLEMEKRGESYDRKQQFLRKIMHSKGPLSADELRRQFLKYDISLDPSAAFLIVLFKIDHFSDFCATYSRGDRSLLKFGIVNIVTELMQQKAAHECLELEEDQVMLLLNVDSLDAPSEQLLLVEWMQQIQQHTKQFLRLAVSVTFSEPFETLSQLNFHYLKTLDLSYYRLIYGHESMIFSEHITVRTEDFKSSQEKDDELKEALIQGHFQEAKDALSAMLKDATAYSYSALSSMFIRILLLIRHAIEVLETNHAMKVDFHFNAYLMKLQKMETIEQIMADFSALFDRLAQELEAKKDNKYLKLLDMVNQIVHRELANPALSLDYIADEVDLSPPYLGKLFKKHRLVSVSDFINNVRLAYASQLVATSTDTITDIMEKSGFSSRSHFFTQFKKVYGLTPSQYRMNAKQSGYSDKRNIDFPESF